MGTHHQRRGRLTAAVVTALVLVGVVAAPASAASAVAADGQTRTEFSSTCPLANGDSMDLGSIEVPTSGTKRITVKHTATNTATSMSDPVDVVDMTGTGRVDVSVTGSSGAFSKASVTFTASTVLDSGRGIVTSCGPAVGVSGGATVVAVVTKKGTLTLRVSAPASMYTSLRLQQDSSGVLEEAQVFTGGTRTYTRTVRPGTYEISVGGVLYGGILPVGGFVLGSSGRMSFAASYRRG